VLLAILALTTCAGPRLEVASAPSQPSVTLTEAGIQLTILPNTWPGHPSDLARYYTPVQIQVENNRTDEIQVRYRDFVAVDDARNQYQAVAPADVARALSGARWPHGELPADSGRHMPPHLPLLAGPEPWWPYGYWPYRPWYPYYDPFYPDPFYSGHPYWWYRPTAYDILTLGLREGRTLPGARIQGFLYFQLATQQGSLLTLTWIPASADGKPLASLSTQFRIVR
jgi:ABC-type glycerol-3-phosphate transport system substrate-binding protein